MRKLYTITSVLLTSCLLASIVGYIAAWLAVTSNYDYEEINNAKS